jgi:hypothetical protein
MRFPVRHIPGAEAPGYCRASLRDLGYRDRGGYNERFAERNGQQVSPLHHSLRCAKDVVPVEMTEIFGGNEQRFLMGTDRDFSKAETYRASLEWTAEGGCPYMGDYLLQSKFRSG